MTYCNYGFQPVVVKRMNSGIWLMEYVRKKGDDRRAEESDGFTPE
jgi:hypothetical protein